MMDTLYYYIKYFDKNIWEKTQILDIGNNTNNIVNTMRNKMYICIYDLLLLNDKNKSPIFDDDNGNALISNGFFTYNNIFKLDNLLLKPKKYDYLIIHNNLDKISELIYDNNNKSFKNIIGSLLFLMKKNGYIFLIIDDHYKKKYNIIMDNYLDKKIKMISCIALNKQEFFKYYLFIIRK